METQHSPLPLPPGTKLFGYEIVEKLGAGAFGIVYRATLLEIGGTVAIKEFLPAQLARRRDDWHVEPLPDQVEAFQCSIEHFRREARTLRALAEPTPHPNIVKVELVFETNDTVYFSMQWEEGRPLDQVLNLGHPWPEEKLQALLVALLDGLQRVHEAQVLHRDIKPSNILVRPDGSPVLIDFGAARRDLGDPSLSRFIVQTPGYAPPEQSWGECGAWTDIYALAASMFELLTGSKPIPNADSRRLLSKELAGTYSPGFLNALDAGLEPDWRLRPQSVAEWRLLFEPQADPSATVVMLHPHPLVPHARRYTDEQPPAPSAPQETAATAPRQPQRRGMLLLIGGLATAAALGVGVWLWQSWLPGRLPVTTAPGSAPTNPWEQSIQQGGQQEALQPGATWLPPRSTSSPEPEPDAAAPATTHDPDPWAQMEQQASRPPDAAWLRTEPTLPSSTQAPSRPEEPPPTDDVNPWMRAERQASRPPDAAWLDPVPAPPATPSPTPPAGAGDSGLSQRGEPQIPSRPGTASPQTGAAPAVAQPALPVAPSAQPDLWRHSEQEPSALPDVGWLPFEEAGADGSAAEPPAPVTPAQPSVPEPAPSSSAALAKPPKSLSRSQAAPPTFAKAEPPAVPALPPAADSIRAAIATLDCADIELLEVGRRSFELHGHVATDTTRRALIAALKRIPSIRVDIKGIEVLSAPVCSALAALAPYRDSDAPEIRLNHPDGRYVIGDPFAVAVRNRDRGSGRLHLYFISAADEVMAFPDSFQKLLYRNGTAREAGFDIGGPAGADLVLAVWCRGGTELPDHLGADAATGRFLPELRAVLDESGSCGVSYSLLQVLPGSTASGADVR